MDIDPTLNWPPAPHWAILAGELGRWLILTGLFSFVAAALSWALSPLNKALERLGKWAFTLGCLGILGAIVCLGSLFVNEQFEYNLIRESIQSGLEIKYKIAAIWAHQEGSFLLWGVTSSIFGLLAVRGTGVYRRWFTVAYSIFLGSLCAILAYETPFELGPLVHGKLLIPPDGAGLTPSLQNYWVVIHPPTIFTGFGSLTVLFCFAVAAMLTGNVRDWVKMVRPWALVSISILGLGLCMGGFWAYETLGWGGFWAWDPVENVSFVPWIMAVTFAHGLIVQATRKRWGPTNLLLGGLPFLLFVYGTFLTRSGLYADVSVHSFAQMDKSALKILLGFLVLVTLAFAVLWIWRGRSDPDAPEPLAGVHRESLYRLGMITLGGIGVATAIGMSVPLIMSLANLKAKVVEERLYHQVLVWLVLPLLILMATAPFAGWRSMPLGKFVGRVLGVATFSFMFAGIALFVMRATPWSVFDIGANMIDFPGGRKVPAYIWVTFLLFLCIFTALGNFVNLLDIFKRSKASIGGFIAHIGVATLLAGMFLSRGFEQKDSTFVQEGRPARALDYIVTYKDITGKSVTDRDGKVLFNVTHINKDGTETDFVAQPGFYYAENSDGKLNAMVWPHIQHQLSHDIYFTLHEPVLDLWKDPVSIKPGDTVEQDQVRVTYEKMTMEGQPGQVGTKFGAILRVRTLTGEYKVHPTMELTADGLRPSLTRIDQDLLVTMQGMNAADRSGLFQIHYANPIYPIDLFYKPMTILVWTGTGILTFGGLLSAWYRRRRKTTPPEPPTEAQDPTSEDAVSPVAQV